jgi:hypothetical protein
MLVLQISSRLHERDGKALTNFERTPPPPGSDLAEQILKDPYNFDFLTVTAEAKERCEYGMVKFKRGDRPLAAFWPNKLLLAFRLEQSKRGS